MWLLNSFTTKDILIDVAIYAILFNIIYSMTLRDTKKTTRVILYIIVMSIKFFVVYGGISFFAFFISTITALIVGLIMIKISDEMVNYHPRFSFVVINIAVAFFLELLLGRLLYVVIGMIMFFAKIWIYSMFNINYD